MSRFVILLGGELRPTPRLQRQIAGGRVIAADSGMRHAASLGVTPELWLGDFDSVSAEERDRHDGVERLVYPADKDNTDGELAIEAALGRGASELVLAGAFGGPRADHAFLHMTAAIGLCERGVPTLLTSGREEGTPLLPGSAEYDYAGGTMFSLLAFTGLSGLTVRGAKWPLADVEIAFGSSLTLSNEVRGALSISLRQGRALLLAHVAPDREG